MNTYLILDASNLVYRTFFANNRPTGGEFDVEMCYLATFNSLAKYHRKYQANDVVIVFDMPNSWRKLYTKDTEHCKTHKIYKGQRRQNLTESEKLKLAELDRHLDELATLFVERSGLIVLRRKYLEADDLIAGFVQKFKDHKNIIVSADKDFIQLLRNGNVTLIDPLTDTPRDLKDWNHDAEYFMFEKCFRGDAGDNIQSSYPRLRSDKIQKAYTDEFLRTNLMNHKFIVEMIDKDGKLKEKKYVTKELYEENQLLMDLTKQPEYIRELMDETIEAALVNRGKYNLVDFVKFCRKHHLQVIIDNVSKFSALLTGRGRGI